MLIEADLRLALEVREVARACVREKDKVRRDGRGDVGAVEAIDRRIERVAACLHRALVERGGTPGGRAAEDNREDGGEPHGLVLERKASIAGHTRSGRSTY